MHNITKKAICICYSICMAQVISVSHLSKKYKIHKKEPGFGGSIKSFVNRKYEFVDAVKDVSFEIEEGELVGFIGPNGAGKTTTLKCLSGLLFPTSGEVKVLGFKPHERKHDFLRSISLVMGQKSQLWWNLPPLETFLLNKEIYGIGDTVFKKTLDELVEMLDLKDILKVQVRKLSLGQRMKCELVASLLHQPKVLFLDEPTIGLDVVMQDVMRNFITEYNKKFGASIMLTSHYMKDVERLCRRVIVIDKGELLFDGDLSDLTKKYRREKLAKIETLGEVDEDRLKSFGKVKRKDNTHFEILVPQAKIQDFAGYIATNKSVADFSIEDIAIEDVISQVFSTNE